MENHDTVTRDIRSENSDRPLEVITWIDRGRAMAELIGELDVYTAQQLSAMLTAVQKAAPRPLLLLVLDQLTFADSSGLGVMIGALRRARANGGAVALTGTPRFLAKVLLISGLDAVLPSFGSFEEAWGWLDAVSP